MNSVLNESTNKLLVTPIAAKYSTKAGGAHSRWDFEEQCRREISNHDITNANPVMYLHLFKII